MKQIAQNYRSGELTVLDVPRPSAAPGGVVVRSLYSLISTGTEMMKVGESKLSLIGKAKARPDQVKKVLDAAVQQGVMTTYQKAMNRLDSYTPLGYSLAGVVVEVGRGAEEFSVGQLVACAGAEFAVHADYNWVPVNLCVAVPDGVDPRHAAFSTVGAIALQGVRQADPKLGDTACVIGLGLVGQLVVQLLVASGVKVVGVDVVAERCKLAEAAGAVFAGSPDETGIVAVEQAIAATSGGIGADSVFLVAGGATNGPVETAVRVARDRATVVDIGKCKLDLPWNAYYEKELDVRFSRSYGPGRYDPRYEVEGIDYPVGYVRWTERRNLSCILDLVASSRLDLEPLISGSFPVGDATEVYSRLGSGDLKGVGFLFEYAETTDEPEPMTPRRSADLVRPMRAGGRPAPVRGRPIRLGFVGAGNYASSMLLPHLVERNDTTLVQVATRRSLSATNAQRKFHFARATTDVDAVIDDPEIDALFVVTRHSTHAGLVCRALEAGKAVFVEKPLCLTTDELDRILDTVAATGNDRVMVGFNRRFSPILNEMRDRFGPPRGPSVVRYLVNAGTLSSDSWYRQEDLEGTRFAGEGGHFIDTVSWWLGAEPVEVLAAAAGDTSDLEVRLRYPDGSLATVSYLTTGHGRYPKETMDVTGGRRSARLDNFARATVWAGRRRQTRRVFGSADKGQGAEVEAFIAALRTDGPMPISLESVAATTRATLAAATSLASGRPEPV